MGARFSAPLQTDFGAHPAFYTMDTWSLPGVKHLERGAHHLPHLALRLKKEYSYTSTPPWVLVNCSRVKFTFNPLNPELNPICYLLALLGAHHFYHVSRIRVKLLNFRLLMSYIYGAPILDVSRSHTTTQHSR